MIEVAQGKTLQVVLDKLEVLVANQNNLALQFKNLQKQEPLEGPSSSAPKPRARAISSSSRTTSSSSSSRSDAMSDSDGGRGKKRKWNRFIKSEAREVSDEKCADLRREKKRNSAVSRVDQLNERLIWLQQARSRAKDAAYEAVGKWDCAEYDLLCCKKALIKEGVRLHFDADKFQDLYQRRQAFAPFRQPVFSKSFYFIP